MANCRNCEVEMSLTAKFCQECEQAQSVSVLQEVSPIMSVEGKQTFIYGAGPSREKLEIYPNRIEIHHGKKRPQVSRNPVL